MSRFRALGRLEGKFDETMVEYYLAFMAMCKRVANLPLSEEEGKIDVSWLQTRLFQCFPRETFVLVIARNHTVALCRNVFLHFRPLVFLSPPNVSLSSIVVRNCSNQSFLFAFPEAGK